MKNKMTGLRIALLATTILFCSNVNAQTKQTENVNQIWLGYFNQTRFSNKWGTWTDLHLRTKEDFATNFSTCFLPAKVYL